MGDIRSLDSSLFICLSFIQEDDVMKYTMRDVNKLIMSRGWPRWIAMEYYIDLAQLLGDSVSKTLQDNYQREVYYGRL